jgi:predicted RNA-binding Zn-ribbon protein involved in translation (DUF1610 family)
MMTEFLAQCQRCGTTITLVAESEKPLADNQGTVGFSCPKCKAYVVAIRVE